MRRCKWPEEGISVLDSEEHLATTTVWHKEGEGKFQGRKNEVPKGEWSLHIKHWIEVWYSYFWYASVFGSYLKSRANRENK